MRKEDISRMAIQAGLGTRIAPDQIKIENFKELSAFASLVAAYAQGVEREACAKIAEEHVGQDLEHNFSALIANNIRARWTA